MAAYHKLNELSPIITGWTICVRIMRVFNKYVGTFNRFQLGLILVDETGQRIEATVDRLHVDVYLDRIRENEWKHITCFLVRNQSGPVRATSHGYRIMFTHSTVVTNAVAREVDLFKQFTLFDYIYDRTFDTSGLVDVLGALVEVGELTNSSPTGTDIDGYKFNFTIKDKDKEVIDCEALGSIATNFYENYQREGVPNMVIALVMWKVERDSDDPDNFKVVSYGEVSNVYPNPDIPEVNEIRMALG